MEDSKKRYKLAVLASHPIQYQAPFFRVLSEDPWIDLTVYYAWDFGVSRPELDKEMGVKLQWDIPLLFGYKYVFLKNWSLKPGPSFFGQINPGILSELSKNSYDAVIVHGYTSFTSWMVFFSELFLRRRIILRGEADLGKVNSKVKQWVKGLFLRTLFRFIDAFLYSYSQNKDFFMFYGVPEEKLFFLPCAVDNEFFSLRAEELKGKREELLGSFHVINRSAVNLLYVGKFIPRKCLLDVLRAYEKIKDRVMVNILFAGNGSDREVLQRFVEEHHLQNVYFLGFMNQSLLPQVYSVSDVLLLPSEFDPSPKVVNEAMNFGLPVIVSSGVGTAPDLVLRGKTGFQYPVGDIAELARLIELIVNNEELRKTLGRNAAQTVRQWNFSEGIKGVHSALSFITNNA